MYTYVTELNSNKEFLQKYIFFSKYHRPSKSQSRDISLRYEDLIIKHTASNTINMKIDKTFKYNRAMDYISSNKYKIETKPINRLRIRTLVIKDPKELSNKLLIKINK
jgi:hypothetical protein